MKAAARIASVCGTVMTVAGAATAASRSLRSTSRDGELTRLESDFRTSLRIQLEAARRYDRRFTLSCTRLERAPLVLADVTRNVRSLDAVAVVGDALFVMWWNTGRAGASLAIDRLVADGILPASDDTTTGMAIFPDDGLTVASLLEAATAPPDEFSRPALRAVPDPATPAPTPVPAAGSTPGADSAPSTERRLDEVVPR